MKTSTLRLIRGLREARLHYDTRRLYAKSLVAMRRRFGSQQIRRIHTKPV
jgi:hypothetical protein